MGVFEMRESTLKGQVHIVTVVVGVLILVVVSVLPNCRCVAYATPSILPSPQLALDTSLHCGPVT